MNRWWKWSRRKASDFELATRLRTRNKIPKQSSQRRKSKFLMYFRSEWLMVSRSTCNIKPEYLREWCDHHIAPSFQKFESFILAFIAPEIRNESQAMKYPHISLRLKSDSAHDNCGVCVCACVRATIGFQHFTFICMSISSVLFNAATKSMAATAARRNQSSTVRVNLSQLLFRLHRKVKMKQQKWRTSINYLDADFTIHEQ